MTKIPAWGVVLGLALACISPALVKAWLDGEPNSPGPRENRWSHNLVGKNALLPETDSQGEVIEGGRRLLIALPCSDCAVKQYKPSDFKPPKNFSSTLIVFDAHLEDVPEEFVGAEGVQVLAYPKNQELTAELLYSPPQAFLLDHSGTVQKCPDRHQTLIDFVQLYRGDVQ